MAADDLPSPVESGSEEDPDYRFTLANERTFLAWLRTALALLAAAVALVHLIGDGEPTTAERGVGVALAVLGVVVVALAMRRWRLVQVAMRRNLDLPRSNDPVLVGVAVLAIGVAVVVMVAR
jgi:putative membrane protein